MKRILGWTVSLVAAAAFLSPLLFMLLSSFRPGSSVFRLDGGLGLGDLTLDNYATAWRRADLARGLVNSLLQVALIAGGGLLVNGMAAFAFARLHFRGREPLFALVVALVILPIEVVAVPLFLTARDLGLTGAPAAALAGLTLPFVAKAFNVYFLRQQLLDLPSELEEAAALDGAGVFTQCFRVALPAVKPALATVVLLDVLVHSSDFLWPLLIATRAESRTVQVCMANLFTQPPLDWGAIMACAVLATAPVLALFRVFQRYVVVTDARAGIK